MLGGDPGEDGALLDQRGDFTLIEPIKFAPLVGFALQTEFTGNGGGRHPVVAGDHLHLDAGGVAGGNGRLCFCTRRVNDTNQRMQGQILNPGQQIT